MNLTEYSEILLLPPVSGIYTIYALYDLYALYEQRHMTICLIWTNFHHSVAIDIYFRLYYFSLPPWSKLTYWFPLSNDLPVHLVGGVNTSVKLFLALGNVNIHLYKMLCFFFPPCGSLPSSFLPFSKLLHLVVLSWTSVFKIKMGSASTIGPYCCYHGRRHEYTRAQIRISIT